MIHDHEHIIQNLKSKSIIRFNKQFAYFCEDRRFHFFFHRDIILSVFLTKWFLKFGQIYFQLVEISGQTIKLLISNKQDCEKRKTDLVIFGD